MRVYTGHADQQPDPLIAASSLHAIETGQTAIRVDTLRRIARALHVEPFELLNHDTEIDDAAYIVEKMRVDEGVAEVVRVELLVPGPDRGSWISLPEGRSVSVICSFLRSYFSRTLA